MPESAKPLGIVNMMDSNQSKRSGFEEIAKTHTPELVIGLCSFMGTQTEVIINGLTHLLSSKYGYTCKIIKLSKMIARHCNLSDVDELKKSNPTEYYKQLIAKGNELRENHTPDVLAQIAINEISYLRIEETEKHEHENGAKSGGPLRLCFIVDSFKHPSEIKLFRFIYREMFYSLSVYSNHQKRLHFLRNKGMKDGDIHNLLEQDADEKIDSGQQVNKTYIEGDFFLRHNETSADEIDRKIGRYLNLLFKSEVVTPTSDETAMYLASSAATNSACLSRQVGAAITDKFGEVISVGWNDVPRFGGGLYQHEKFPSETDDMRCFVKNRVCHNDKEKEKISKELISKLTEGDKPLVPKERTHELTIIIKNSKIKGLIEFSRAVHAEMHALILGCQKAGTRIIEGKLYCTTYPCHNCARHIIAAGIIEVYYIEPYPKSLAVHLHEDAITEEESNSKRVRILLFEGVAPKRYLEFFRMESSNERKDLDGNKVIHNKLENKNPQTTLSLQAIPFLETKIHKLLQGYGLLPPDGSNY